MDDKNLLTVVLLTYNHAPYIKRALDSILAQKTGFAFKVFVCDDASTDGTSDVVRAYAAAHPGKIIPFIREKNIGIHHNFLKGISAVDTKYLALLEGDDYWCDETKLEQQVNALETNPGCTFCGHNTRIEYSAQPGKQAGFCVKKHVKTRKIAFPKQLWIGKDIIPHTSSKVIRTAALELGLITNKEVALHDMAQYWWLLSKGDLFYIDKVMSVYNITGGGIYTGKTRAQKKKSYADFYLMINKELGYKYNRLFARRLKRFLYAGWIDYLRLKYFTPQEKLEAEYKKLYDKFIKKMERRFKEKL